MGFHPGIGGGSMAAGELAVELQTIYKELAGRENRMFSFLADMGTYERRKVARYEAPWGFISTARCSDGRQPHETAVEHLHYNDGEIIIVAAYDTKAEAESGHHTWIEIMEGNPLPEMLVDVPNSHIAQLEEFGRETQLVFPYKEKP